MSAKPPNSDNDPDVPKKRKSNGVSRRGFLGGVGVGGGALSAGVLGGVLPETAEAAPQVGPAAVPITLRINGQSVNLTVEPRVTLLDAFRNYLDITGAKRVCDRGTCGACTAIVNGKVMYSCTVLAVDAQGKDIQTIEGIGQNGKLHPVSAAFVNNDGQQCGYCTPGFVMAVKGFLDRHPDPSFEDVEKGLGGNLCRCGTYVGVRKAALEAAKEMKGARRG